MPRLQALRDLHDSKPQIDVVLRGCVPLVKLTPHTALRSVRLKSAQVLKCEVQVKHSSRAARARAKFC